MKLPQLSLRELFLLVALVAMGCGWWVERRGLKKERDRLAYENAFITEDAQNLAFYWQIFRPCKEGDLRHMSVMEEQFHVTRLRYKTDSRPFLWHHKQPDPDLSREVLREACKSVWILPDDEYRP